MSGVPQVTMSMPLPGHAPANCQACGLCASRKHVLNGIGQFGGIMIVGSMPDYQSDDSGVPFDGRPGQLIGMLLGKAGIPRNSVYRTYAVRCLPPGKSKPKQADIDACHDFLIEEIKTVKPAVIVALGTEAAQSLLGTPDPQPYLDQLQAWGEVSAEIVDEYREQLETWEQMSPSERKETQTRKPRKPKLPKKPLPSKAKKITLKDSAGHIHFVQETGTPVIPSYAPQFIMHGKWEHSDLLRIHLAKAQAIVEGRLNTPKGNGGKPPAPQMIDDINKLEMLADYLTSDNRPIWFDTETTGVDWMEAELLCISFSKEPGERFVVPILHNDGTGQPEVWPGWAGNVAAMIHELKRIFENQIPKGGHNVIFDVRMLERHDPAYVDAATAFGINVQGQILDTELLAHAVEESLPHNMTSLLAAHTTVPYYEDEIKQYKKDMARAPDDVIWPYSGADAEMLPILWDVLEPYATAEGTMPVLENVTTPMIELCREIETNGLPIDRQWFDALCKFYEDQIDEAEDNLWRATPHRAAGWKYNDAKTLRTLLHQELGLPTSGRKTKGGRGCQDCKDGVCFDHDQTGKDALIDIKEAMVAMGQTPHPVLDILIRLKNVTKRKSTYLDGGRGGYLKHIRRDGYIHPTIKISRTETGRLASEAPNVQNLPNYVHIHPIGAHCADSGCKEFYPQTYGIDSSSAFHDMVKAPKGYVIMDVDWSQLEVWVLAYKLRDVLGDTALLDVLESGQDIHLWMARQMFPEIDSTMADGDWKKAHPDLRRRAKTANFGIGYGLTTQGYTLRERCTEEEADDIIKRWKSVVPIDKYFNMVRRQITTQGYIENWAGRRRHIGFLDILKAMRFHVDLDAAVREAINFPIQSGGSDLHSIASYRTLKDQYLQMLGAKIIGSVHDSLTLMVPVTSAEAAAKHIKALWSEVAWETKDASGQPLHWQVPAEASWGERWGTEEWEMNGRGDLKDLRPSVTV
jgi:uracil-DNA glycosylase family 4